MASDRLIQLLEGEEEVVTSDGDSAKRLVSYRLTGSSERVPEVTQAARTLKGTSLN